MHNDQYTLPPLAQRLGQSYPRPGTTDRWYQFSSTPPDDYEETEAEKRERQRATRMVEIPPPVEMSRLDVKRGDIAQEGLRKIILWVMNFLGKYTDHQLHEARLQLAKNLPGDGQPDTLVGRLEANFAERPVPQGADDLLAEMKARLQPAKPKGRRP